MSTVLIYLVPTPMFNGAVCTAGPTPGALAKHAAKLPVDVGTLLVREVGDKSTRHGLLPMVQVRRLPGSGTSLPVTLHGLAGCRVQWLPPHGRGL